MKIRSITTLLDPGSPLSQDVLQKAGQFIAAARPQVTDLGYHVQTTRLATVPFPQLIPGCDREEVVEFSRALEAAAQAQGYDYVAIGHALPHVPQSYQVLPDVFAATEIVFAAGEMASADAGISLPAVRACADVIYRCAPLEPNGFGNLYFTALANVPPGTPFFPAAYHAGGPPVFAFATESADLAVEAFAAAGSLAEARANLIQSLESHARKLSAAGEELQKRFDIAFGGIDLTLAPFPEQALSLGTALERLGVPAIGMHGSLAAAAFLADAIDRADFSRAGFCGLFFPVLEDAILAARADQGTLTVADLLMYSAVCGTGLDTVPLPGDTSPDQIAALLLDMVSLSQRLEKPLTARLMPIPGKKAGEPTGFDFPYFANSRVMPLRAAPLERLFTGDATFRLHRR